MRLVISIVCCTVARVLSGSEGCIKGTCADGAPDEDDLKVMWATPIQKTTLKLGESNEALRAMVLKAFEEYAPDDGASAAPITTVTLPCVP
jgi:hypothetical protein